MARSVSGTAFVAAATGAEPRREDPQAERNMDAGSVTSVTPVPSASDSGEPDSVDEDETDTEGMIESENQEELDATYHKTVVGKAVMHKIATQ